MRLLLDTHIWLWSIREPDRLNRGVRGALNDAENEFWLSPISVWEALLLYGKGRINLHADVDIWIKRAIAPFREAPLTHEIVIGAQHLVFRHLDPADRFLAATAQVLGLTLITADRRLLGLPDIATLANR